MKSINASRRAIWSSDDEDAIPKMKLMELLGSDSDADSDHDGVSIPTSFGRPFRLNYFDSGNESDSDCASAVIKRPKKYYVKPNTPLLAHRLGGESNESSDEAAATERKQKSNKCGQALASASKMPILRAEESESDSESEGGESDSESDSDGEMPILIPGGNESESDDDSESESDDESDKGQSVHRRNSINQRGQRPKHVLSGPKCARRHAPKRTLPVPKGTRRHKPKRASSCPKDTSTDPREKYQNPKGSHGDKSSFPSQIRGGYSLRRGKCATINRNVQVCSSKASPRQSTDATEQAAQSGDGLTNTANDNTLHHSRVDQSRQKVKRRVYGPEPAPQSPSSLARRRHSVLRGHVRVLTDVDILYAGLSWVKYDKKTLEKSSFERNERRFVSKFGIGVHAVEAMLKDLRMKYPDVNYRDSMMAMNWLKSYETFQSMESS